MRTVTRTVVALSWAVREQGLILPTGNPRRIEAITDLKSRNIAARQRQSGSFLLLRGLLAGGGLSLDDVQLVDPPIRSEMEVADAVATGKADAGLGLHCVARQFRLDFVPLARERFDLIVWRRACFEPPLQRLLAFCRTERFENHAAELAGYDTSAFGEVRYNGP